jgi:hypothetical protein
MLFIKSSTNVFSLQMNSCSPGTSSHISNHTKIFGARKPRGSLLVTNRIYSVDSILVFGCPKGGLPNVLEVSPAPSLHSKG